MAEENKGRAISNFNPQVISREDDKKVAASAKDFQHRYDEFCRTSDNTCTFTINIEEKLEKPVYVYYRLENFYSNHRNFVKARSFSQLRGEDLDSDDAKSSCDPIWKNRDINNKFTKSFDQSTTLDPEDVVVPCGLFPYYFFSDEFTIREFGGNEVMISEDDIASEADSEYKFKNSDDPEKQYRDITNEHLMVWGQTETFRDFYKLWGRIEDEDLEGEYTVEVANSFDVESFDGKKIIYFSTINALGGTNNRLGIAFACFIGFLVLVMLAFVITKFCKKDVATRFDVKDLKW